MQFFILFKKRSLLKRITDTFIQDSVTSKKIKDIEIMENDKGKTEISL